jgi:hypothetical protein
LSAVGGRQVDGDLAVRVAVGAHLEVESSGLAVEQVDAVEVRRLADAVELGDELGRLGLDRLA